MNKRRRYKAKRRRRVNRFLNAPDVLRARAYVQSQTGFAPNHVIMGIDVLRNVAPDVAGDVLSEYPDARAVEIVSSGEMFVIQ